MSEVLRVADIKIKVESEAELQTLYANHLERVNKSLDELEAIIDLGSRAVWSCVEAEYPSVI